MIKFIEADNIESINDQLAQTWKSVEEGWILDDDKTDIRLEVSYRPHQDWTIDADPKTSYTEARHYICKAYFNKRDKN